jgi:hypothetical protein
MIDLEASARTLNEQTITPRPPLDVVLARGRRIRLRRRLTVIAITCTVAVTVFATAELRSSDTTKHLIVTGHATGPAPTTAARVPAPDLVAPPNLLIAHEALGANEPGRIVVIDTATGRTIRVLGADYDPYLANGFAIARKAQLALWTRLNEPAQMLELVEVPLVGGAKRVLTSSVPLNGKQPTPRPGPALTALDPAGDKLWMNGNTIVDLLTGDQKRVHEPPIPAGWSWVTASWLPDGHKLFMVETRDLPAYCDRGGPLSPRTTPPACITTPASRTSSSRGFIYDLNDPQSGWHTTSPPKRPDGWWGLQILGPGRLASTIVGVGAPPSTTSGPAIMTINVASGAIIDHVALPPDSNVLSVDASGTNVLFTAHRDLERLSIADTTPIVIGKQVAEAAW